MPRVICGPSPPPPPAVAAAATAAAHQDAQLFAAFVHELVDFGNLRAVVAGLAAAAGRVVVVAARSIVAAAAPGATVISCHCLPIFPCQRSVHLRGSVYCAMCGLIVHEIKRPHRLLHCHQFFGHCRVNRNRAVEIFFRGTHLDGDARQLDHLARVGCDDMTAQHLARFLADHQLHQHPVVPARQRRCSSAGTTCIDLDRFLLAGVFFGQPDGAHFGLGKDRGGDQVMIDRRGVALNTVSTKAMPSRIATGVSCTRLVTSPMA